MSAPSFSPIAPIQRKLPSGGSSRKHQQSSAQDGTQKPKYQCPGCQQLFAKWSPCLAHLREKQHVQNELLDKKLNGGDFRRVQEMCATLAYHHRGGSGGRERTDSNSSAESLSSDSGEDEDANNSGTSAGKRTSAPKQRFAHVASLLPNGRTTTAPSSRLNPDFRRGFDLKGLEERIIFRILTFLDVDSSRMLFLAMTITPRAALAVPMESRVRMWSVSSDPDSLSLPSSSPQSSYRKRISTPLARTHDGS